MAGRRRVIFRKSPAAAAGRRRIMFLGEPKPYLLDDGFEGHDLAKAVTTEQIDLMTKACAAGDLSPADLARASHARLSGDVMPVDLYECFARALR
jgi:hypothetical protein